MNTVNGLPAHIILVHAVVVLLPLAALLLVLTALRPATRRRFAGANAILSVVVLVLVPITTNAGEWLERRVDESDLLKTHTDLGDTALFVAIPVAILALIIWWRAREEAYPVAAGLTDPADSLPTDSQQLGTNRTAVTTATPTVTHKRTFLKPRSAAVGVVISVLSVIAAAAAVYDIYLIGDSGAQAVWQGSFSDTPAGGQPSG